MLAGALTEMVKWWLEHHERSTPAAMDRTFNFLAHGTTRQASYMLAR
jgi:hypothetical protein